MPRSTEGVENNGDGFGDMSKVVTLRPLGKGFNPGQSILKLVGSKGVMG